MALEELRDGDDSVRPQLIEARDRFVAMQAETIDRELDSSAMPVTTVPAKKRCRMKFARFCSKSARNLIEETTSGI